MSNGKSISHSQKNGGEMSAALMSKKERLASQKKEKAAATKAAKTAKED